MTLREEAMVKHLKIAFTDSVKPWISSIEDRTCIPINETDFTNIGAVVVSASEMDVLDNEQIRSFGIPIIVMVVDPSHTIPFDMERIAAVIDVTSTSINDYKGTIEQIVAGYEALILPPFFKALSDYVGDNNAQFDCPGHQGGQFFAKHPTGRAFYDFFGDHIFRADLCNADVKLGDLLIHEGYAHDAQAHAAAVYNADKTYFVLNGTSSANKVVLNALLTPGDIILYDRNNHKSICHGGLVMSGATPIYLETARNPFGSIGGILEHCFNESYIRNLIGEKDPNKAKADRPIRLAIIQLGTYDGTIYNARQVVDRIGHLCDYIFFPGGAQISAFVNFEKPIIYYTDATFHIMIDYYWHGLSSWLITQGEHYEKEAIKNAFINIRSSQWAAASVINDYDGCLQRNYVLEFGANFDDKDLLHATPYKSGALNILFSGVDWIRKGGEVAVKTVQLLNKRGINSCLFIVGLSEIPLKYANLPFVRIMGFLDKNNPEHYRKYVDIVKNSHLLLLPTNAECSAIVFSESSAFGLPIFTYDTGGTGNYVIDGVNGYKLPLAAREQEFADAIEKSLESNEFLQLHKGGITLFNERLNWSTWSKRFRKIMEENNL